jgi:membrane-associated phospholipid phosphatase
VDRACVAGRRRLPVTLASSSRRRLRMQPAGTSIHDPGVGERLKRGIFGEPWRWALIDLLLIAAVLGTNLIYDALNHGPNRIFLRTPLDDALPVVPLFAVPYVSLIPFIGASLLLMLLFRARLFRSAALSMIAVWFISYAFYFFLQSYVARPEVTGTDFFSGMVRSVYAGDQPYNDFPSLHTSLSTIIAIHWWHAGRRVGVPAALVTALIVASTVLIKQHYLADVAAGLVLGGLTATLLIRWTRA